MIFLTRKENSFNAKEIDWPLKMLALPMMKPPLKILKLLLPRLVKFMDYILIPSMKLFKRVGGSFRRMVHLKPPECDVVRLKEYFMPLNDGAKIATDIYLPKPIFDKRGKGPTLLIRLPYWKDLTRIVGYFFASYGFITILQDVRGCVHSPEYGTNTFMMHETVDGEEALKWIAKRFWYNKRIGMWGGSYFGLTQLALSENKDGLLTSLSPSQCSYANFFSHPTGLFQLGIAAALYPLYHMVTFPLPQVDLDILDKDRITDQLTQKPLANLYNEPLKPTRYLVSWAELAQLESPDAQINLINEKLGLSWKGNKKDTGQFLKFLKALFYHRQFDTNYEFFTHVLGFNYTPKVPMLILGGLYDMFFESNIHDLKRLQETVPDYCKKYLKVVFGPFSHGGVDPMQAPMKLKIMISFIDCMFSFWWLDYWLKGSKLDINKVPMIRLFILNKKVWRNFNSWPPKSEPLNVYLHSQSKANSCFGDGTLSTQVPQEEPPDEYDFDPANPVPTKGGRNLLLGSGPMNQLKLERRQDILVYTSEKLKESMEVIGEIKLVFYAASSAKDTDFMVKLVDVHPNGRVAFNILDEGLRARFREGDLATPSFLEPGKIYRFEINLGTTAIYFAKNHRIRLEISSSNFPKYDINSNLAGSQNDKGYITAHQKIFHDFQNQSYLILPVFKGN